MYDNENNDGLLDNQVIWRYMDFAQFTYMLEYKALYFNRADNFKDEYEGTIPNFKFTDDPESKYSKSQLDKIKVLMSKAIKITYINCWHINEVESAAMWEIYPKGGNGLAIKSTRDKLKRCFIGALRPTKIGSIKYIDFKDSTLGKEEQFFPLFNKRKSFSHETELRVTFTDENHPFMKDVSMDVENNILGLNFAVDLNILIDEIYISPDSQPWITKLVIAIKERYSLNAVVNHSRLYDLE